MTGLHSGERQGRPGFLLQMACLLACLLFAVLTSNQASAQESPPEEKTEKAEDDLKYKDFATRRRRTPSPECGARLQKVQEFFETESWAEAEMAAMQAMRRACKKGFEHSEVNNWIGVALFQQDKIPEAIDAYKLVVNEPEADPDKRVRVRYNMAQLMFMQERYDDAAEQLEIWLTEVETPDRGGKVLLAKAYYNLDKKDRSLSFMQEVMAESKELRSVPKEGWLSFLWVLHYEREEYKKAVGVSHTLLTYYPKNKYWKQLTAMFAALEDERNELLGLEVTYMQDGLDKEKQLMALAYRYMAFDTPFRAAYLIEKGIEAGLISRSQKNLEVLGSAWQRSQEFGRASPILEEAAALSDDGNVWSRLAGVYLNINENEKALDAAEKALAKGGLKREDLTWMNKGTAEASLHCYSDAEQSFARAAEFPKTERSASNWANYVKAEGGRRARLIARGAKIDSCLKA